MTKQKDLWDKALTHIQTRLSKPSYETWLKFTTATALDDNSLLIVAPNGFTRDLAGIPVF